MAGNDDLYMVNNQTYNGIETRKVLTYDAGVRPLYATTQVFDFLSPISIKHGTDKQ